MKIFIFQRMLLSALADISLALLVGCASVPLSPPDASNPIAKVAVLPINNFTSDTHGPEWMRSGIIEMVLAKHYMAIPIDQVDDILREKMGVTLGGQIDYTNPATGAPSPSVVGQTLEVDGLIYCNLEDFQNFTIVVFIRRKVKVKCSLVNVKTTNVVWKEEKEAIGVEINMSAKDIAIALINTLKPNPLDVETAAVIKKMKSTIPSGPIADAEEQDSYSASDKILRALMPTTSY